MLQKSLLTILSLITIFIVVQFIDVYSQTIYSLDGIKKMYVESLIFKDNPEKLKQFKQSKYYKKLMNAKTGDSVRYYYKQFITTSHKNK